MRLGQFAQLLLQLQEIPVVVAGDGVFARVDVGDPLGRLERLYGARALLSAGTARTFLIDPAGILRFHILHSVSGRGMGLISELLGTYQADEVTA